MTLPTGGRSPRRWSGIPVWSHATPQERSNWELHAAGQHIHWPDLDEDLSVEGLLAGRKSGEGRKSLERWLEARKAGHSVELRDLLNAARGDEK